MVEIFAGCFVNPSFISSVRTTNEGWNGERGLTLRISMHNGETFDLTDRIWGGPIGIETPAQFVSQLNSKLEEASRRDRRK